MTLTVTDDARRKASASTGILATDWTPCQAWRTGHFSTPHGTGDASNNADPDHDGIANLIEYAINGDPWVSDSDRLPWASLTEVDPARYLMLSVPRNPAATDVTLQVEVSGDLSLWNSGPPHTTVLTDESDLLEVRDNIPADSPGRRFIRLKVTEP